MSIKIDRVESRTSNHAKTLVAPWHYLNFTDRHSTEIGNFLTGIFCSWKFIVTKIIVQYGREYIYIYSDRYFAVVILTFKKKIEIWLFYIEIWWKQRLFSFQNKWKSGKIPKQPKKIKFWSRIFVTVTNLFYQAPSLSKYRSRAWA
jgi:hypothetical protein